jgi:hypothetical protein
VVAVVAAAAAAAAAEVVVVVAVAVATGEVLVVETGNPRTTINKAGRSRTTSNRVGKVKCFCYKKHLWGWDSFDTLEPGVFSAFNRNEYQKHKNNNVSGE